jgi:hypothetical protein
MTTKNPCQRAAYLRDTASSLPAPIALAYKRRAAELELKAHLLGVYQVEAVAA